MKDSIEKIHNIKTDENNEQMSKNKKYLKEIKKENNNKKENIKEERSYPLNNNIMFNKIKQISLKSKNKEDIINKNINITKSSNTLNKKNIINILNKKNIINNNELKKN